jgi:glycosyltransferase involved in cell wall biosynthesis
MKPLVEIRVPTYRRPDWLAEALASIRAQTMGDWQAIVFDDSPDREAEKVVASLHDERIIYRANPTNLGAAGNLNLAFPTQAVLGAKYACVVEDDNWLLPDCLEANIQALESSGLRLLARNQEIWGRTLGVKEKAPGTTLSSWYEPGVISPLTLHAFIFFFYGVSNGSLFWRTDMKSRLEVSEDVNEPWLQEHCRCAQIWEPLLYEPVPKAAYAYVLAGVQRQTRPSLSFGRFLQVLRRELFRVHGPALVKEAETVAARLNLRAELERNLLNALIFPSRLEALSWPEAAKKLLMGAAKICLVPHPASGYRCR